jgi:Arc/MetJ-type ribon-helix-helix transcriptional regulator
MLSIAVGCYHFGVQVEVSGTAQSHLEQLLERGGFANASEAVATAIEALWIESEASGDELEVLIQEAFADIEAGRTTELTPELAAEVAAAGRARLGMGGAAPTK